MADQSLEGRIALVTGASRGIGRAAALALAEAGAHVIALARTVGGLEELDDAIQAKGGSTTLVPLDLKDFAGIDRMGAAIFERWGKLDMLLANAGILGVLTPLTHLAPRVWDDLMAVNVTANWRLIRSLDPLLRQSDAGRAVFMSSGAARIMYAYWGPYSVSKSGLETLVRIYAAETATTPLRANILNPGPFRTRMRAEAVPGEDPSLLPAPEELSAVFLPLVLPSLEAHGEIFDFKDGRIVKRSQ
jgi:NAD(P)-dependent dehydrogenase (short-subunit alcohol dehydrogenase family)